MMGKRNIMKAIGEFLRADLRVVGFLIHVVGFLAIVAIIGFVWIILLITSPLAPVLIFVSGLGAAIAHNKGRGFLEWLFWGTLFPGIVLIVAIAIRRPPVVVHVSADVQHLPVAKDASQWH